MEKVSYDRRKAVVVPRQARAGSWGHTGRAPRLPEHGGHPPGVKVEHAHTIKPPFALVAPAREPCELTANEFIIDRSCDGRGDRAHPFQLCRFQVPLSRRDAMVLAAEARAATDVAGARDRRRRHADGAFVVFVGAVKTLIFAIGGVMALHFVSLILLEVLEPH